MKRIGSLLAFLFGCHGAAPTEAPKPAPPPTPAADAVPLDQPQRFKNGAHGTAGDVAFTLQMLPKLMVSGGPAPEIEQLQIQVSRGAEHAVLQVDTIHKTAAWGGVEFELGYADVYHDDIQLTVRRR